MGPGTKRGSRKIRGGTTISANPMPTAACTAQPSAITRQAASLVKSSASTTLSG